MNGLDLYFVIAFGVLVMLRSSVLLFSLLPISLAAETLVKARYEITIAGFRIGIAGLEGRFSDEAYEAGVSVKLSGIAKMMAAGQGSVESDGKLQNGKAFPSSYRLNLDAGDKREDVSMDFAGVSVKSLSAEPQRPTPQGTIPVLGSHKANVLDPLSAGVFTSSELSDKMMSDACNKVFPIFDGRQRYDMSFTYDRKEPIRAIGYRGEALICKARYTPISGHVAGRADVTWLANNRNMEVWLVPVKNTKTFLPARIKIDTQMGMALVEPVKLDLGGTTADAQ
jgi:hypothetical protein